MLYDPATQKDLRAWLIRALEPICDADPIILADYVIALLTHDGPEQELRKMFTSQLEEFLEQQSAQFVDRLFSALRSKAYIPYSTGPVPEAGIPIPIEAVRAPPQSPRQRIGKRTSRDFDGRPPPKAPRHHEGTTSRHAQSDMPAYDNRVFPQFDPQAVGGIPRGPSQQMSYGQSSSMQSSKRQICRDYHHKGYCARGALCIYSHGEDAIVPPNPLWMGPGVNGFNQMMTGIPLMPLVMPFGMPPPSSEGTYDPNESRLDMPNAMMIDVTHPPQSSLGDSGTTGTEIRDQHLPANGNSGESRTEDSTRSQQFIPRPAKTPRAPRSNEDKTLVIDKIPADRLQLSSISEWFSRFGEVTNIAVDLKGAKALVSFSTHDEAHKAWKSQDAVFGNRFVKVYWHHPLNGQGQVGKQALAASAGTVKNIAAKAEKPEPTPTQPSEGPSGGGVVENSSTLKSLTQDQRGSLERNIAQQKVLFSRLKTANGEEKKQILAEIRSLSTAMDTSTPSGPSKIGVSTDTSTHESADQLTKLDKELDLQQAVQELTRRAQDPSEDHSAIRAEMERLIAKASNEGIRFGDEVDNVTEGTPPVSTAYRNHRGHTRARGFWRSSRGRGGHAPRNMKLDNRPRKLIVSGVDVDDDLLLEHIREWHQATGQADLLSVESNRDIVVQFRTRSAAEQAFTSSSALKAQIPGVKLAWPQPVFDAQNTAPTPQNTATPPDSSYNSAAEEEQAGWGQD